MYQDSHRWVDKTIAVVAPLSDAANKGRLERTAKWMHENFQKAQLSGDVCIRLNLQWYDEDSENAETLAELLANDNSVAVGLEGLSTESPQEPSSHIVSSSHFAAASITDRYFSLSIS